MSRTKIEWADAVWNPVTGCTPVSEGCRNCYAKRMAKRLAGRCGYPADDPFRVTFHPERLNEPLTWSKPKKRFVCSMSDLFHEDVTTGLISSVLLAALKAPRQIFIFLTKRPERMAEVFERVFGNDMPKCFWVGVTAENQQRADERIPILLQIPAAVRFVSVEPMLGPIDLTKLIIPITGQGSSQPCAPETWRQINALTGDDYQYDWKCHGVGHQGPQLNWIICGGESGPGARPLHPEWARNLRNQCVEAGVPFNFKQWGEWLHETQGIDFHEGHKYYVWPDESMSFRVGKKRAGRILDGRIWDEFPEIIQKEA